MKRIFYQLEETCPPHYYPKLHEVDPQTMLLLRRLLLVCWHRWAHRSLRVPLPFRLFRDTWLAQAATYPALSSRVAPPSEPAALTRRRPLFS